MSRRKQKNTTPEDYDLTKKYRPSSIDEIRGNSLLKKSLNSVIQQNKIPHAIMLTGPTGCAKTSIARILASVLGCSKFDLREIDVADFSGIDMVRDLRRKVGTAPMNGKVKVYILDEVGLLGRGGSSEKNEAQSALLKILEEPPKHVYFFLCTTDPQNVLKTIHGRCVQYQVQTLSDKQMFDLLNDIAKKEGIDLPKQAALQIVQDSLGHPRTALKALTKIRYLPKEEMLKASIQEIEKQEEVIALCRALVNKKSWKEVAGILRGLRGEPESVRLAIRGYFSACLLNGMESAFIALDVFRENFYNTDGKNELVRGCYEVCKEFEN